MGSAGDGGTNGNAGGSAGVGGSGGAPNSTSGAVSGGGAGETSGGASGSAGAGVTAGCAPTVVSLRGTPVHVLLDVSSSMGSEQFPYFSRELKWEPVVAAFNAFTEDAASQGMRATLTFFPNQLAPVAINDMSVGDECVAEDYATPDVPLTPLPSPAFSAAIDAVTPPDAESWRRGGPMVPAFEGALAAIKELEPVEPGRHAVLFITDGMPALCSAVGIPDSISPLLDVVEPAAARVSTYVLGIANPVTEEEPNPPDVNADFQALAEAGGTEAYLIPTEEGQPTVTNVRAALESIRDATQSCAVLAPELPDGSLDADELTLSYENASGARITLEYDQSCDTEEAWRFDDASAPRSLVLCESICQTVRDEAGAGELTLDPGCQ